MKCCVCKKKTNFYKCKYFDHFYCKDCKEKIIECPLCDAEATMFEGVLNFDGFIVSVKIDGEKKTVDMNGELTHTVIYYNLVDGEWKFLKKYETEKIPTPHVRMGVNSFCVFKDSKFHFCLCSKDDTILKDLRQKELQQKQQKKALYRSQRRF